MSTTTIEYRALEKLIENRRWNYRRDDIPTNPQFDALLKDTFEIVLNGSYGGYCLDSQVRKIMKRRIEDRGYEAFALEHGFDISKFKSLESVSKDDLYDNKCRVYYNGVIEKDENPAVTFLINSSCYRTNPFFISCVKELKVEDYEDYKSTPIYYKDDSCVYYIEKIPMYLADCASISEYDGAESIEYEAGHFYKKAIPNLTPETVDDLKLFQQVFDYHISRR